MYYTLQYGEVWRFLPDFMAGAWVSFQLSFTAFWAAMVIGLFGATAITWGGPVIRRVVGAYVRFVTNTPVLVQIFFIYFALPDVGIVLTAYNAALIGFILNSSAYLTQIQRAGFLSVHQNELDAAESLGMSRLQTVRYVVVPHIARVLFPPLSSYYILLTLATSIAGIFGVEELTGRAFNAESLTFRSIEIFTVVATIYVAMTLVASTLLVLIGRYAFRVKMRII